MTTGGRGELIAQCDEHASARPQASPACQRCGFPVPTRPFGCKNPCANCGTVYPLGDCSD